MTVEARVLIDIAPRPYVVGIGPGLLLSAGDELAALTRARRVALVTDTNVDRRYGGAIRESLSGAGFEVHTIAVAPGEASKSWVTAGHVLEALAAEELDRTGVIVALGGGVVGDLAGFAAAVYLRGIDLVQLPTTLLAQVDSSVGGKTGVDLEAGKNLAGAFKQPLAVYADTSTLASLPETEWRSGLAEVAKAAVLDGVEFLGWLESSALEVVERQPSAVLEAVSRSVEFKARIVSADEREVGLRESLNYGHTFGHALEKVAGYGNVAHGVAVAEGIRFASTLAVDAIGAPAEFAMRQGRLLNALHIPRALGEHDPQALRDAMASDKKARGGRPRFVLADSPGSWRVTTVEEELLVRHIEEFVGRSGGVDAEEGKTL